MAATRKTISAQAVSVLALASLLALGPLGCGCRDQPAGGPGAGGGVLAVAEGVRVVTPRVGPVPLAGQKIAETRNLSVSFYGRPLFKLADAFGEDAPSNVIGLTSEGFEMRYSTGDGELICSVRAKKASWGTTSANGDMATVVRLSGAVLVTAGERRLRAPRIELSYLTGGVRIEGPWLFHGSGGMKQGTGLSIACALPEELLP